MKKDAKHKARQLDPIPPEIAFYRTGNKDPSESEEKKIPPEMYQTAKHHLPHAVKINACDEMLQKISQANSISYDWGTFFYHAVRRKMFWLSTGSVLLFTISAMRALNESIKDANYSNAHNKFLSLCSHIYNAYSVDDILALNRTGLTSECLKWVNVLSHPVINTLIAHPVTAVALFWNAFCASLSLIFSMNDNATLKELNIFNELKTMNESEELGLHFNENTVAHDLKQAIYQKQNDEKKAVQFLVSADDKSDLLVVFQPTTISFKPTTSRPATDRPVAAKQSSRKEDMLKEAAKINACDEMLENISDAIASAKQRGFFYRLFQSKMFWISVASLSLMPFGVMGLIDEWAKNSDSRKATQDFFHLCSPLYHVYLLKDILALNQTNLMPACLDLVNVISHRAKDYAIALQVEVFKKTFAFTNGHVALFLPMLIIVSNTLLFLNALMGSWLLPFTLKDLNIFKPLKTINQENDLKLRFYEDTTVQKAEKAIKKKKMDEIQRGNFPEQSKHLPVKSKINPEDNWWFTVTYQPTHVIKRETLQIKTDPPIHSRSLASHPAALSQSSWWQNALSFFSPADPSTRWISSRATNERARWIQRRSVF